MTLISLLFHLREDVTDDTAVVIFGDVKKLRPREDVVKVILHLVILRETEEIASLHREEVVDRCFSYAHHGWGFLILGVRVRVPIEGVWEGREW